MLFKLQNQFLIMPKKPKQYPLGTFQLIGKKRKLFIHAFPNASNTLPYRKGLHAVIEAWMLEHPGKQLPAKDFNKKYKIGINTITKIAKRIEQHHNLPARKHGGPRFRITREGEKIIERFYLRAGRTKEKKAIVWEIIKEIAKTTGMAFTIGYIQRKIHALEKKHNKGVRAGISGLRGLNSRQIVQKLQKEGITAKGRPKIHHIL